MKVFTRNNLRTKNLFTLMYGLSIFLCSCNTINTNAEATYKPNSNVIQKQVKSTSKNDKSTQISNFNGVSITSFIDSVSKIQPQIESAVILESEDNKPNNVHSRFISLIFDGNYTKQRESSFFSPKLRVYSVEDFRQALAKSPSYVQSFDERLSSLKQIISNKQSKLNKRIPFIPFIDGRPSFISQLKYISFKNGNGLIYLTQFDIEPSIINNEGLTYLFQGLTSDGKYYILATFPIRIQSFPNDYTANNFNNYKLPDDYNNPKESDINFKKYQDYIIDVEQLLNSISEDQFEPNLQSIEKTINSLEVK